MCGRAGWVCSAPATSRSPCGTATFAFTEVRIGVAPAVISLPLLPRVDPRALARYCLTGETFGAVEAARIGLVTLSAGDGDLDEAMAPVLDGLRRAAPTALARTKEAAHG